MLHAHILAGLCAPPFIMIGCPHDWKEKEAKQAELQGIGLIVCALIIDIACY